MSGHIWLEKRVAELEEKLEWFRKDRAEWTLKCYADENKLREKLEELSKDRDDWAKKYQELSKKNEVTYDFDHTKGFATQYTHIPYGYRIVAHGDGTITVTQAKDEK